MRVADGSVQADLALLKDAALEAGAIALRFFRRNPEVWLKAGQSPVSEADFAVDRYLKDVLTLARPSYGWLSEETADTPERLVRERTFVVDPIDGTRAFIQGLESWCVSVAVVEGGRTRAGVLQCPARQEIFWATEGGGAFKNGRALSVRQAGDILSIAGPKSLVDLLPQPLLERVRRVAHVPSLAYRVAMIADATIDASFVKPNAHDWDLAAADLILQESGGVIRNAGGTRVAFGHSAIVHGTLAAGSGTLLEVMTSAIRGRD